MSGARIAASVLLTAASAALLGWLAVSHPEGEVRTVALLAALLMVTSCSVALLGVHRTTRNVVATDDRRADSDVGANRDTASSTDKAAKLAEHAAAVAAGVREGVSRLDDVRLPLQILLESPFGALNENQEELLRDARAAADAIDVALRQLGELADLDRNALQLRRDVVAANDLVRSLIPLARANAERQGAGVEVELEPVLPHVIADRLHLAEALTAFLADAAARTAPATPLRVSTARTDDRVVISIAPSGLAAAGRSTGHASTPALVLAAELIRAQGGALVVDGDALTVRLPTS